MKLDKSPEQQDVERVRNNPKAGDVVENDYLKATVIAAKDGYVCYISFSKIEPAYSGVRAVPQREWLQCFIDPAYNENGNSISQKEISKEEAKIGEEQIINAQGNEN